MVTLPNIGLFDVCLGIVYLFIIYFCAYHYQQKKINTNPEYHYFLVGLTAKLIGSIAFVFISIYYYKKGDTFLYFQIAEDLRNYLQSSPKETLKLIITPYHELSEAVYNPLEKYNYYYERTTTWSFSKIVFFFNLISFGSYLVSSILFALLSYVGLWLGYSTLCKIYTHSTKLMLIPFFMIPTAIIWSSGILKDTLMVGSIGLLLYSSVNILLYKKQFYFNIILCVIVCLLILLLKPILLLFFIPFLVLWGTIHSIIKIRSNRNKIILVISVIAFTLRVGFTINNHFLKNRPKYQITHLMERLKVFHTQHPQHPVPNSKYTLGEINYSILGTIKKTPEAINTTFFRPYLWEVHNIPTAIAAIEALLLFIFFIMILFRIFITNNPSNLFKQKEVLLMILFSITYGAIVGISSTNFGALSRQKIPAVFFFLLALIIIVYNQNRQQKSIKTYQS